VGRPAPTTSAPPVPNVTIANTTLRLVLDERGTPGATDVRTFVVGGVATCGRSEACLLDEAFDQWRVTARVPEKATKWDPRLFHDFADLLIARRARPFSVTFACSPTNIATLEAHLAELVPSRVAAGRPAEPESVPSVRNWLWSHSVTSALGVNLYSLAISYRRIRAVEFHVGKYSLRAFERNLLESSLRELTGDDLNRQVPATLAQGGYPSSVVAAWALRMRRAAAWGAPSVQTDASGKRVALADAYCALVGRSCDGDAHAAAAAERLRIAFESIDGRLPRYLMHDFTADVLRMARSGWSASR
jgi:hypothetical protein